MANSRKKNAILNISMSVVVQATGILVALFIPRLLIKYLGSDINGLISLTNQFSIYMGIIEGGVAAAAGASLYLPILNRSHDEINDIMTAVHSFYFKTGLFLFSISMIFIIFYPIYIRQTIPIPLSILIIGSHISIPILGYFNFNKYNMMLVCHQKHYVMLLTSSISKILIALFQYILIYYKASVYMIVSVFSFVTILRLLIIKKIVTISYPYLSFSSKRPNYKAINQKWNALFINLSQMSKNLIPMIFLSFASNLKFVSVYSIYALLFHLGSSILETSNNGLTSIMGEINYSDSKRINACYSSAEQLVIVFLFVVSGCFMILSFPFIHIYLGSKTDINYLNATLLYSFIINEFFLNLRFCPKLLLKARGHLNEYGKCGLIEMFFTLLLTPIVYCFFGENYILLGNIICTIPITFYLIVLTYQKELHTSFIPFIRRLMTSFAGCILGYFLCKSFITFSIVDFIDFFCVAAVVFIVFFISIATINALFFNDIKNLYRTFFHSRQKALQ